MSKIKIGVIGLGFMGLSHARNIAGGKCPELELTAVSEKFPARLEQVKAELGENIRYFDDAEALLDSKLCDAVLIATPHYDHPGLAMAAFARGIHVLCEKPAGVYTAHVREMNEAADKSGVVFGMMFQQRTLPAYKKMFELVQSGTLGNIRRVSWIITNWFRTQSYYDSGAWRATWAGEGGGVLLNQCPHNLDLFQWICGMPEKIRSHCHIGKWHDIEVEDDVTAYMEFPNGATGTFITSTGDLPGSNRFEIALDKGKLVCEDGSNLTLWELNKPIQVLSKAKKESEAPEIKPEITKVSFELPKVADTHMMVANEFAGAILRGTPLVADGREGINSLTLSNAMYLSAWTESEVKLPIDDKLFYDELMKRVNSSKYKA
ncbi:MAG: Gfo/Idh/MocA family oxidoreductase [Clostridiales bacterium]|jgi:predicted dehydrogenase|nr:Gfo/Idh/MocA family oxidoreductase [Clostridiales bacterium]